MENIEDSSLTDSVDVSDDHEEVLFGLLIFELTIYLFTLYALIHMT